MKTRKFKKQGLEFHETGSANQCQCDIHCVRPALPKKAFCKLHINRCSHESPLSGWEPQYDPSLWNLYMAIKETHNCFSYAMNVFDKKQIAKCYGKDECNAPFHQPGASAGYEKFSDSRPKTCPNMIARILGDNPTISVSDFTTKCPPGKSKIALIVDESDDYHFLRQDSSKYWSHKPGGNRVTRIDALGHTIWDPRLANYDYTKKGGKLKYDIFCSYMCVPRNRPLFMRIGGGKTRKAKA